MLKKLTPLSSSLLSTSFLSTSFAIITLVTTAMFPLSAQADSAVVDKIYHPYVLPLEREVEWRLMSRQNDQGNQLIQRLGIGMSWSETLMIEAYVMGDRDQQSDFGFLGYEIEARWMLTEQGQYWVDLGLLFELEKTYNSDQLEFTTGLLLEKEFGNTSLTINALISAEWGNDLSNEIESKLRLQYRYRWLPAIQPAIELYVSDGYHGIGPALMGLYRFDQQKQLKWEARFISGISSRNKDHTFHFAIEYEF